MHKLLYDYFIHTNHYLATGEIINYHSKIVDGELVYIVTVANPCLNGGYEDITIYSDDLLVFVYLTTTK